MSFRFVSQKKAIIEYNYSFSVFIFFIDQNDVGRLVVVFKASNKRMRWFTVVITILYDNFLSIIEP